MARLVSPGRRQFLTLGGGGAAALLLAGCDRISGDPGVRDFLGQTDRLTEVAQRLILGDTTLAPEFPRSAISGHFRANGNTEVADAAYNRLAAAGFADYRLEIGGLVERPASLSLADLAGFPARTQITRHDCVEGWSCIGEWSGPPLSLVLDAAGLRPEARFVVFHCFDEFTHHRMGRVPYYESIGLIDAFHPQTILATAMNGATLPIRHGAPVRLRVERQLGYKMAKFVRRIEAVATLAGIGLGKGGYYEDGDGYEWYAGI